MTASRKTGIFAVIAIVLAVTALWNMRSSVQGPWSEAELVLIRSLWIENLPPVPADPSNAVADDPHAARLGQRLFFDTRLSANGAVSCATCHQPELQFTDGLDVAEGVAPGERNTMGLVGVAYSPWMFWDGRKDSLWAQALAPLESPVEHGGSRGQFAELLASDKDYRMEYEALFGEMPELSAPNAVTDIFVNMGKAIAAYERLLLPGASQFDRYVESLVEEPEMLADSILGDDEVAGLRLFIGDAQCINCHNGPLFTNNDFHNTAVLPAAGQLPSLGRVSAVREVNADPFNCLGNFSDHSGGNCAELRFARTGDELIGAHKTPSLRNVALTAPYMHAGQMQTLAEIINQYNRAPLAMVGHNEAKPLGLSRKKREQLEAFLHTLNSPVAIAPEWLQAP